MSWFSKTIIDPLSDSIKNSLKKELKETLTDTAEDIAEKLIDNKEFSKTIEKKGYRVTITTTLDFEKL